MLEKALEGNKKFQEVYRKFNNKYPFDIVGFASALGAYSLRR